MLPTAPDDLAELTGMQAEKRRVGKRRLAEALSLAKLSRPKPPRTAEQQRQQQQQKQQLFVVSASQSAAAAFGVLVDPLASTFSPSAPTHTSSSPLPSHPSRLHASHLGPAVSQSSRVHLSGSVLSSNSFLASSPPNTVKMATAADAAEANIQIWKVKKLVKQLDAARGAGTSMISLILPPRSQISQASNMLTQEYGTASNIKSRVNRLSVLAAITSTQQRLKLYNRVPDNGLVVYCGTILTDEGKEKKVNFSFEPFKPINTSLYLCDNKFHTEALSELLEADAKFGFIVMDGNGSLFGTLSGNTRTVLQKLSVDLPKKHGRGGQSALRFARLREEARHNYVRKIAELSTQHFITDNKCNVAGLVLAGSADFKTELSQSDMFDYRLQPKIVKIVDVSYGGENGFNQAIELAAETLSNVKFVQEKKLIQKYFDEISMETGKYCFGLDDTFKALDLGAVETLIVWENLDVMRYVLKDSDGSQHVLMLTKEQEKDRTRFMDRATGEAMEQVEDPMPLLEWLAENYRQFGTNLEFVTDRSQEGMQFCKGFGGIGGILRYKVAFEDMAVFEDEDEFMSDDSDD